MINLLMPRKATRTGGFRKFVARVSAVAAEFRTTVPPALPVDDVEDVAPEELPELDDIEAAAAAYFRAADQARAADRAKTAAKKILNRVPVGRFGAWNVERVPSGRQTVDLDAVRKIFKQHGLGPVPMKTSAPSLRITRVELDLQPEAIEAELTTLAGAR